MDYMKKARFNIALMGKDGKPYKQEVEGHTFQLPGFKGFTFCVYHPWDGYNNRQPLDSVWWATCELSSGQYIGQWHQKRYVAVENLKKILASVTPEGLRQAIDAALRSYECKTGGVE